MTTDNRVLKVDEENNSGWWDGARERLDADGKPDWMSARFAAMLSAGGPEAFDGANIDQILNWCAEIPGWDDGPAYAKHPLMVVRS